MPKGDSGIRRNGGKTGATAPVQKTPEEVLADNIKVMEKIAERGLMHKGALYYGGTAEQRTKFYEAVDRTYKRMPEGYGYSFRERVRPQYTERWIQLEHVYKREERYGSKIKKRTQRGMITSGGLVGIPNDLQSQSALRGYAKAHVFMAAGKIYDPNVKGGRSEEYQPL